MADFSRFRQTACALALVVFGAGCAEQRAERSIDLPKPIDIDEKPWIEISIQNIVALPGKEALVEELVQANGLVIEVLRASGPEFFEDSERLSEIHTDLEAKHRSLAQQLETGPVLDKLRNLFDGLAVLMEAHQHSADENERAQTNCTSTASRLNTIILPQLIRDNTVSFENPKG